MPKTLLAFLLLVSPSLFAQLHVAAHIGTTSYSGELTQNRTGRLKPAIGAIGIYEATPKINLRAGLLLGKLEGSDQYNSSAFLKQVRNLSFITELTELHVAAEYNFFNLNRRRFTPYIFGGLALFHFNPYIINASDSNKKVFLQPLSTEGQGLSEYPDRKPYGRTQIALPFGGGFKYLLNDNIAFGLELGLRKTFTDYLDDVSTTHVEVETLLMKKGAKAVQFAYRGDEVKGETESYPDIGNPRNGTQRGNPNIKDWYQFTSLHIIFRLSDTFGKPARTQKTYGCTNTPAL